MKKLKSIFLVLISVLFSFTLFSCSPINNSSENKSFNLKKDNNILVHYINVGQGDSILIQVNNKNMLIDAGPTDAHEKLISYLKSAKVSKIDYFITTHPHEDHIGGASYVLKTFDVEKFYAPKKTYNTLSYRKMIQALKQKNLKIHVATEGVELDLGNNTKCEMFSPNRRNYENVNNYSPIIKLTYKNNSFLFTGDAEALVENDVLKRHFNVSSDVLKLGHHGSSTSTTFRFLKSVHPKIAIACCGKNNKYGHPHKETIKKLQKINCKLLRTDLNGNILLIGDGNNIEIKTQYK